MVHDLTYETELSKIFDELDDIYHKLIKLIEINSDPSFVSIIAQVGKTKGEIYKMKMES